MNRISLRAALLASCMAAFLAGCGGGGDDGGSTTTGTSNTGSLPSSATSSVEGLVAYMKGLIATSTDSTSEPVSLGNAVLPTSDTSEPITLN